MTQRLSDRADENRAETSTKFLKARGFEGHEGLIRALASDDIPVRAEAAFLLGRLGEASTIDALRAALEATDARVRVEVALALARLGEEARAKETLRQELQGQFFADAPLHAARALAILGDPVGYRRVQEALASPLPSNRMEAVAVLPAFAAHDGTTVDGETIDLTGALLLGAGDAEEIIRRDALSALAGLEDERVVPALRHATRDPEERVRNLAAFLLEGREK